MSSDVRTASLSIVRATTDGTQIRIAWSDGTQSSVYALWLRDNCQCELCRHSTSGQRLLDPRSIAAELSVVDVVVLDRQTLEVTWQCDRHVSVFAAVWLRAHLFPVVGTHVTRWNATTIVDAPSTSYADVVSDSGQLRNWLNAVTEFGWALLIGVPTEPGIVLNVVELFGYVRETNYGRLFDVQSTVNPSNLAYTGLPLEPHTDNPYRNPTPSLQLLHCLSSSVDGGETILVDGFQVAENLRRDEPRAFDLLARTPVAYRYQDESSDLTADFPVIACDSAGKVREIHFNNRSRLPFMLPERLMKSYYEAYLTFADMLTDTRSLASFRLEPGHLILMDNVRVLHGRTGFATTGHRHLQGCYADGDGLRSTLAVLERSDTSGTNAWRAP